MADSCPSIQTVFSEAIECDSQEAISAYLAKACKGDAAKRKRVEALLRAHSDAGGFFAGTAQLVDAASPTEVAVPIGTQIGAYKLRELIGEGGMGEVYVAEQTEPVRRKVALKIIKPGMATKDVVARFEAERQALAMMDHPNIAKVFDGGSTKPPLSSGGSGVGGERAGQPYFVMELVLGVPITDYCDEHQLTTRQRLELFLKICQAVHHAHQKGVIHRDIKPGNVLVAEIDGAAVPKVIDFGVAKAIDQKLTKDTVYTNVSQMIGTPLYMSPEQATLGVVDVDIRSDVYSLGVLLYELLTGQTPFDRDTLKQAAFEEIQRIIREDEPPRPSTRVSTLKAEALSTVSAKRRSDPRRLSDSLRGELDWIVMKCLEKDRSLRYESARELAADVQRYLAEEPVHALPASKTYRFKKFIRKHRFGVATAAAILFTLSVGIVSAAIGFARAVAERDQATANLQLSRKLIDRVVEPAIDEIGMTPHTRAVFARLVNDSVEFYETLDQRSGGDPDVRAGLARALTRLNTLAYQEGGDATTPAKRAISLLTRLVEKYPDNMAYRLSLASAHSRLAEALDQQLRFREGVPVQAVSLELLKQLDADYPADERIQRQLAEQYYSHGSALYGAGQLHLALRQRQVGLELALAADLGINSVQLHLGCAEILVELGRYYQAEEHLVAARRLAEDRLASLESISERKRGEYWLSLVALQEGLLEICKGNFREAEEHVSNAMKRLESAGEGLAEIVWWHYVLGRLANARGVALAALDRPEDAIASHQRAIAFWQRSKHPQYAYHVALERWRIGELHYAQDRRGEGNKHLVAALRQLNATAESLPGEPYVHQPLVVFLCTSPNEDLRDYERAVRLAEEVITESNAPMWRYLGLARYRAGDWFGAEEAIRKTMQLRNGGDAVDLLLLAGTQAQSGHLDLAQRTYATAEQAIADNRPVYYDNLGVIGFQEIRREVRQLIAQTN